MVDVVDVVDLVLSECECLVVKHFAVGIAHFQFVLQFLTKTLELGQQYAFTRRREGRTWHASRYVVHDGQNLVQMTFHAGVEETWVLFLTKLNDSRHFRLQECEFALYLFSRLLIVHEFYDLPGSRCAVVQLGWLLCRLRLQFLSSLRSLFIFGLQLLSSLCLLFFGGYG